MKKRMIVLAVLCVATLVAGSLFLRGDLQRSVVYAVDSCCGLSDPGNPYPCDVANCVWYASFKRQDIPDDQDWGFPDQWLDSARAAGFPTGTCPHPGAIVVFGDHLAYVEGVHFGVPQGGTEGIQQFTVSELNWPWGSCDYNRRRTKNREDATGFIYMRTDRPQHLFPFSGCKVEYGTPILLEWYGNSDYYDLQFDVQEMDGNEQPIGSRYTFATTFNVQGESFNLYNLEDPGNFLYLVDGTWYWRIRNADGGAWGEWATFELENCVGIIGGSGIKVSILSNDYYCPPGGNPPPIPTSTPFPTPTPTPRPTATSQPTNTLTPVPTNTPTSEPTFFVAGQVTGPEGGGSPISGVNVCASGRCAVTDSSGHYRIEGLSEGTYKVTPSKEGLSFIPSSKDVTGPPDVESVNFVGVPEGERFAVSGFVTGPEGGGSPISGVEVCVTGHEPCAWTDGTGNYRIENISAGAQVVVPEKEHYTFIPPSKEAVGPPDVERVDFVGVPSDCCYTVWGYVSGPEGGSNPIPGVLVEIRGHGSSITDHNGKYTIGGLEAGHYKVLPYDDRYDIGPVCKWVDVGPDQEHINFVAFPTGPPPGVTLYEHADYGGVHQTFTDDIPNLANICFGDNFASSLKIVGSYTAILYDGINYQGASEVFTESDPGIWGEGSIVGNDNASSLRVLTPTPTSTHTPTSTPTPTPCTPLFAVGDFDCNCVIDVVDIMQVASRWRCKVGDECYGEIYDLDHDGDIDIVDIMLVVTHWSETCEIPTPTSTPRPTSTPEATPPR